MKSKKLTVRDFCAIGVFAAVICVLAPISIPMPYGVPMTLQTFVIPLAGVVLGARNGTLAVVLYVLLGAVGLPVFAGLKGGIGVVLGPTGGFILSFPLLALAAGLGGGRDNKLWLASGLVLGAAVNYLCGMLMFSLVASVGLSAAFYACVLPFIPTTVIKIVLTAVLGLKLKSLLARYRIPA